MKTLRRIAHAAAAMVGGIMTIAAANGAPFPYYNDFSTTALTNATSQFALDTNAGLLNYNVTGTATCTSTEPITGIGTSDFRMSARFTLNSMTAASGVQITLGFGAFGSSTNFDSTAGNSYYLADWGITNGVGTSWGQLRLLGQGHSLNAGTVNGDSDGSGANGSSIVVGNTYELRLTGTYAASTLNLNFSLFDDAGNQIGTSATGSDSTPLMGQFFGLRDRTANALHKANVSYDKFSVGEIPQPIVGDYSGNNVADAADYVVWRKNLDTAFQLPNEEPTTTPGQVTPEDYGVWRANYGQGTSTGTSLGLNSTAGVPEPSMLILCISAIFALVCFVRRR